MSMRVAVVAALLAVVSGPILHADSEPIGKEPYVEAYEQFMLGDLAGAREAFKKVRDLPGADPAYAADAGARVGWLHEVAQRLDEAHAAFALVEARTNAPALYRAEGAIGVGQCLFETGDPAAASNAFERALTWIGSARLPGLYRSYAYWLKTYAVSHRDLTTLTEDDPYYNNRLRRRAVKWPSPLEQQAREDILRRWLSDHGLSPERCYLKGQWVSGTHMAHGPYPSAGFPYNWEFDGETATCLSLTQGVTRATIEQGCLKLTTGEQSAFGWGRTSISDQGPGLCFGGATNMHEAFPSMTHLRVRLRQSLQESTWRVRVGHLPRRRTGGVKRWESKPKTVRGTDWQEVVFRISAGKPPYMGVYLFSDTPGNNVEIDWVRPEVQPGSVYARKELQVPTAVRWARISVGAGRRFRVFVNGRQALQSPPTVNPYARQLWNFTIDADMFRTGKNVVAIEVEGAGRFLVDAALLCEDGTHLRFDTDSTWRSGVPPSPAARPVAGKPSSEAPWSTPDYTLPEDWEAVQVAPSEPMPLDHRARFWFNPSWKGRIMVAPTGGRSQPVFGATEPVALQVAVPRQAGVRNEVTYQVFDEMGDGCRPKDEKVAEGNLKLETGNSKLESRNPASSSKSQVSSLDEIGLLTFKVGELPRNSAYAVIFKLFANADLVETYRYELAVCGPVELPTVANPTNYTDGMDLKLVWEMDAADDPPPDAFISVDGTALPRPSTVIETPLGRFRQPYTKRQLGSLGGSPCNYISYRYKLENPGRPHVAIADYPDDTVRVQEMRITEGGNVRRAGIYSGNVLANDTVVLGFDNPLTHELRRHHCLFFPGRAKGTVSFLSLAMPDWEPSTSARVGKVRIYEVVNDVPVRPIEDGPGPRKWLGQLTERGPAQIWQSCFSSPVSSYFRQQLMLSDSPVFYRNWMVTAINMVKRMKFAGENAHFMGQYMYDGVLYPSTFADNTAMGLGYSGSLRDYGVLLAKMFEENDLALFTTLQIIGSERIPLTGSDEAVAAGRPTFAQVDRRGRQQTALGGIAPNWVHPDVRGFYEEIIEEVTDLYGGEAGWKGIVLHQYDTVGPSWFAVRHTPGDASFDDITISLFEKDTGLRVPVEHADPDRFAKRHAWLMANAKMEWTDWRCRKMHDIYAWTAKQLKACRPDLDLIVYAYASYLTPPLEETPEEALPSLFDYGRRGGIDLQRIKTDPDMILAGNVFVSLEVGGVDTISGDFEAWLRGKHDQVGRGRALAHRDSVLAKLANDGKSGLAVRYNWYEAQPRGPDYWLWNFSSPESWPYPQDDYFADYWINSFVRAHPRLILHPLMDMLLWNGREVSMSRFAQAFRSLPATVYTTLTGNGRDRNVRIATGVFEGYTYGYVANPYWWQTEVSFTLGAGVQGRELTTDEVLRDGTWRGRLYPYTMRTFRFDGQAKEAIVGCTTTVSKTGLQEIEERMTTWQEALEQHRTALEAIGRAAAFRTVVHEAQTALHDGEAGSAYERLNGYAAKRLWGLLEVRPHSPFLTEGWSISRLLPREQRDDVRALGPVKADDPSLRWQAIEVGSNRVLAHSVYGDRDGFVYFANRIRVPVGDDWTLCVGHDGGCRVFIDGQEALCQPRRRNPIRIDRTKATINLEQGDHDVIVVLDTDHGGGWGFTMRFRTPEENPRLALSFPAPVPRASAE